MDKKAKLEIIVKKLLLLININVDINCKQTIIVVKKIKYTQNDIQITYKKQVKTIVFNIQIE